jgi:hypothetical protein
VTKLEGSELLECCSDRSNKCEGMRRGGNKGKRALLDGGDRFVDLERLGDRDADL